MQGVHELADLAPRDVVAKAITRRMIETGHPHMWLDARHLARASGFWEKRFPTILATCRRHGVDPVTELIPVAPACHYASGGVATDVWGAAACPGSTRPARSPAPASTGPTGSPPTRCSRGWCSPGASPRCCPASCGPWLEPAADDRPAGLVDGSRRGAAAGGDDRAGRGAALRRRAHGPGSTPCTRWAVQPRAPSTRTPGRRPTWSRSAPSSPTPPCCARRRAAPTGARTSPSATTRTSPATTTGGSTTACRSTSSGRRPRPTRPRRPSDDHVDDRAHAVRRPAARPGRGAGRRPASTRVRSTRWSWRPSTRTCPAGAAT